MSAGVLWTSVSMGQAAVHSLTQGSRPGRRSRGPTAITTARAATGQSLAAARTSILYSGRAASTRRQTVHHQGAHNQEASLDTGEVEGARKGQARCSQMREVGFSFDHSRG